jgi:hypothetical protein
MALWRFVDFSVPEAKVLADLTGVNEDLEATEEICALFISEAQPFDRNKILLLESICAAAIIRYGRSFPSGVRMGITKDVIRQLPPELQADHRYFKNLRDKWIAHSVNTFEENQVVAYLIPKERGPEGVECVSVQQRRVLTVDVGEMRRLMDLCFALRKIIARSIEAENRRVLEYAKSLPVESIYSRPLPNLNAPSRANAAKPREG